MKDQYFADVNDYRKYGFLRRVQRATGLRLGVIWFLTANDDGRDGGLIEYLERPERYRGLDPPLFDKLRDARMAGSGRSVSLVKQWDLFRPDTIFVSNLVGDEKVARREYWQSALATVAECPLLFLDPDNGLEIKSTPFGRKDSSKFVYWRELDLAIQRSHSFIVYQHWPQRRKREEHEAALRDEVGRRWPGIDSMFYRTPRVLFAAIAQPEHADLIRAGLAGAKASWNEPAKGTRGKAVPMEHSS